MEWIVHTPLFMITALGVGAGLIGILMLAYFVGKFKRGKYGHGMVRLLTLIQRFEVFSIAVFATLISAYGYSLLRILPNYVAISQYESLIILLITGISVLLMNFLSAKFGHQEEIEYITSIRLLGYVYAVLNMLLIRFITGNSLYNPVVICYLGMVLGRFIYFDTAMEKIASDMKGLKKNLPLAVGMLVYVGTMFLLYHRFGIPLWGEDMLLQLVVMYTAVLVGLKITDGILRGMYFE